MIYIQRIYEDTDTKEAYRVLVDRLWPRGLSKDKAAVDVWLKEIGPSDELRKWFNHDPKKFNEFKARYIDELKQNGQALDQLKQVIKQHKNVVLLYGAKDEQHNQAIVLQEYLNKNR